MVNFEEYLDTKRSSSNTTSTIKSVAPDSNLKAFDIKVDKSKVREFNETEFQDWYKNKANKFNLDSDPDNPAHFYDYRAAYVAGAEPDKTGHWPSTFKLPGHPRMVVNEVNTQTGEKISSKQTSSSFEDFLDTKKTTTVQTSTTTQPAAKGKKGFLARTAETALQGAENISEAEGTAAVHGGEALKTLGTGLAAMIPAVGSMLAPSEKGAKYKTGFFPVDAVTPVVGRAVEAITGKGKAKNPMQEFQDRLDRARGIAEYFTAEPKTEEAKLAVETISKPLSIIPELATESADYYRKLGEEAEKKGDSKSASAWKALATTTDLGGEVLNFYLLGKAGKAPGKIGKTIQDSTWYRGLTIRERALVTELDSRIAKGLTGDQYRNAELKNRWKNGSEADRNVIRNEMVFGIKPKEKVSAERPITASGANEQLAIPEKTYPSQNFVLRGSGATPDPVTGTIGMGPGEDFVRKVNEQRPGQLALPPGKGNAAWYVNTERGIVPTDNHPVRQAVREALIETQAKLPSPPNIGEGFTTKEIPSTAVIKRPSYSVPAPMTGLEVEYKPVVRKDGTPFPSAETANIVAIDRGYKPGEFEVLPVEDGFGFRRVGQKPKMNNVQEMSKNDIMPEPQVEKPVSDLTTRAKELDVEITGEWRVPGKTPVVSILDNKTKSNIAIGRDETIDQAVERNRKNYGLDINGNKLETKRTAKLAPKVNAETATTSIPRVDKFIDALPEGDIIMPKDSVLYRGMEEGSPGNWYGDKIDAEAFASLRENGKIEAVDVSGMKLADADKFLKNADELGNAEIATSLSTKEVNAILDKVVEAGYDGIYSRKTKAFLLPNKDQIKVKSNELVPKESTKFNIESIKPFIDRPKEARPQLEQLGKKIWDEGNTDWFKWKDRMKEELSDLYKPFKQVVAEVWKGLKQLAKSERGSAQVMPDTESTRVFVSRAQEFVDKFIKQKMDVAQLHKTMQNKGLTTAERNILFGDLKGKVTPEQIKDAIKANTTKVKDVVLGENKSAVFDGWSEQDIRNHYENVTGEKSNNLSINEVKRVIQEVESDNGIVDPLDTQFEQFSEPGYKPGSYREMFVVLAKEPANKRISSNKYTGDTLEKLNADFEVLAKKYNLDYSESFDEIDTRNFSAADKELLYDIEDRYYALEENGVPPQKYTWLDGHLNYSTIANPIVRLRFNERETNGKRILFLEEIQGPSDTNQAKMPKELRDRIYDIGVKRAVAFAKEKGFDEVAWTTGKMQSDRYNIAKYIDQIDWHTTDTNILWSATKNGKVVLSGNKYELETSLGKDIAKKIIENKDKMESLAGLDLQVGGEGIKRLYDETIPGLMEKYGKGKVKTIDLQLEPTVTKQQLKIPGAGKQETLVQSISITEKTPSSFTLYSGLDVIAAAEALRKTVNDIKAARPIVNDIGRRIFEGGKKKYFEWQAEFKEIVGDMWEKIKPLINNAWNTASKVIKNERGQVEGFGESTLGEMLSQRIIRKSEKSKIEKKVKGLNEIKDQAVKEIEELNSPYGEKKFENLKAKRITQLEKEITKLEATKAFSKAALLKRAVTAIKQRNLDQHIKKLNRVNEKLDNAINKFNERAVSTFDKEDVKAPQLKRSDVEFLNKIPDIKFKLFGGYFENPIYTLEEWGRSVKGGEQKVKELFVYPIRSANKRAAEHFKKVHEKSQEIQKSLSKESEDRIGIYALSRDPDGAKVIAEMKKEVPILTPEEMKAYNWMRKGLELFHGYVNKGRAAAGLEPMGYVPNYFRLASEVSIAERLGFGMNDTFFDKYLHNKGTQFTSALERTGGLKKVRTDAFNIFNEYVQSATKHMYLSPETAKMREYFTSINLGKGKKVELKKSHPIAAKVINDYLDFVVGQKQNTFSPGIERVIRFINDNNTIATLSGSVRTPLVQPTALANTYAEIGPKYLKRGIEGLVDKKKCEFALSESDHLLTREFDVSVTPITGGAIGKIARAREFVNKSWLGMKPTKFLDYESALATWIGAYDKGVEVDGFKKGSIEAKQYADDTVIKAQGSAAKEDLAPIQRTNIGKFFTTFQTFVINNWNFLQKEIAGINNSRISRAEGAHKAARILFAMTVINSLFEDVAGVNSPLPAPISAAKKTYEETDSAGRAALAGMLESLQIVPGIGNLRYGSTILGATPQLLADVSEKISSETRSKNSKKEDDAFGILGLRQKEKPWLELGGKLTGIPGTTQAIKTGKILARGGSVPEAIIGDYPDNFKTLRDRMKGRYKNALKDRDFEKANKLRQDVIEWNKKAREDRRFEQVIELD